MSTRPILPHAPTGKDDYQSRFNFRVQRELNNVATDVRKIYDGRLTGVVSATVAPTGGQYAQGDTVRNSAPVEAGLAGSKYVLLGWICVADGSPGTWLEMRVLTGN